nr:glutamate receptor ionotropic, delta-1-like [Procambarus clarkii]
MAWTNNRLLYLAACLVCVNTGAGESSDPRQLRFSTTTPAPSLSVPMATPAPSLQERSNLGARQERAGRDEVAALLTLLTLDLPQPNIYLLHDQSFLGKYTDQSFLGKYTDQSFLGKYTDQSFLGKYTDQSFLGKYTDQSFLGKYTDQSFLGKYTDQSFLGKYTDQSFLDKYTDQSFLGKYTDQSFLGKYTDQSFLDKYTDQSFLGKYTDQSFLGKYTDQSFMDHGSEDDILKWTTVVKMIKWMLVVSGAEEVLGGFQQASGRPVTVLRLFQGHDSQGHDSQGHDSQGDDDLSLLQGALTLPQTHSGFKHFLVLCSLKHTLSVFQYVREKQLESPRLWWLVVVVEPEAPDTLQHQLWEGSLVTLAVRTTPTTYTLMTSRVAASSGLPRLEAIGTWEVGPGGPRGHLTEPLLPDPNTLYGNMGGRQLVVSANADWPFFGLKPLPGGGVQPDSGIDIQIMNTLGQFLNFTYRVVSPADGQWGGPLPDGSVSGVIGQVARRESHLAICEITITANRETVVDFTTPYYLETITLVSRAPAEKSRAFAVFSTFTTEVWVCILASTVAVGPLVSVVGRVVALYTERPPHRQLPEYSFHVFRSLVSQGNLLRPSNWPHRLLFFCWYLFCFYIYALYSGTLTAVLALPTYEKPIDGLVDLPKAVAEGYTIGTISDTSLEFIFKEATEGIYKQVWQLFNHKDRSKSFFRSPDLGFAKILAEKKFVLINSQLNSEVRAAQQGRRKFYMARQTFYPQAYGIACNKGSPFLPKFNQMLRRISEAGLIMQWKEQEISKISGGSSSWDSTLDRRPSAISMKHVQAAFFVLGLGFLLALMMLGAELTVSRLWSPKTWLKEAEPSPAWFSRR